MRGARADPLLLPFCFPFILSAASTLVLAATLPRAIRSFKLAPVLLSNAAIAVGGYYAWKVYEEEHDI
jgi:uncharacterized membrane protein (UPF0136 family)